jgi:hypothetical protein
VSVKSFRKRKRGDSREAVNESGSEEIEDEKRRMEGFPVEVIGNILSHFDNLKDPVNASLTCRNWRLALRHHLRTLRCDTTMLLSLNPEQKRLNFWKLSPKCFKPGNK